MRLGLSIASLAAATAFVAKVMLMTTAAQAQVSVLTQHNDIGRTGQNLSETILTPTSVSSAAFGKLFSYPVDGYIYAQPLYVPGVSIPGQGVHNLVFVATEHDSVYAFDADGLSQTPVWQVSFINPSLGITTVPSGDVNNTTGGSCPAAPSCPNDVVPEIGITGTPVIDSQSGTLYVVALTKEVVAGQAHHRQRLHALDITTGAEKFGGPALLGDAILSAPFLSGGTSTYVSGPTVTGSGSDSTGGVVPFDAVWAFNRSGLLLLNGIVYVAWASHGDSGPYHGWVTAYNAQTLGLVALFNVSPNGTTQTEGGIWMGGGGPAVDSAGNIYLSTGNGTFAATGSGSPAYGDSVLRLDPTTLSVADYFTPFEQANLGAQDLDVAAGGVVVLPDQTGTTTPHLLVAGGKEGKVYLINRDNMGKYQRCGATCDAVVSEFALNPSGGFTGAIFSVPAYFNGFVYYQGVNQALKAFSLTNGTLSSSPASQSSTPFGFPGATPSVSANGTSNGIVWTIQVDGYANGTPAVLHAYNALNLSSELYNSNKIAADQLASGVKMNAPTIANGKVYVGTQTQLSVFGLAPGGSTQQGEVQSNYATPQTKTSSVTVTYSSAQLVGDLNVVVVGWNDASTTVSSVTDTSGNTYTLAVGPTRGTNLSQSIYYAKNIVSAAANGNSVTVNFSAAAAYPDIRILEYSGLKSLDVTVAAVGNSATSSSGTATTTSANEVLVAANTVATLTTGPGAGFASRIITSPDGDIVEDQIVTATGSYQATAPLSVGRTLGHADGDLLGISLGRRYDATDGTVLLDGDGGERQPDQPVMDCLHRQCRGHRLPGGAMLRGRMHQLRPDRHPHEHELFRHGPDGQHQLQLSREGNGRGRQPQQLFQHRHCDHDGHDGRHHQVHPGQLCGPLFGDYSHRYFHSRPDCRKPECCCRWLERYYSYRQLSHRQQ